MRGKGFEKVGRHAMEVVEREDNKVVICIVLCLVVRAMAECICLVLVFRFVL